MWERLDEAVGVATERERRTAIALADDWLDKNDQPQN
jgi:hypothetical protein